MMERFTQQFNDYGVVPSPNGEYVKYSDYQKLEAQLAELKKGEPVGYIPSGYIEVFKTKGMGAIAVFAEKFVDSDVAVYLSPVIPEGMMRFDKHQRSLLRLALHRFISAAYEKANYAGQKGPTENVAKFQDDAKAAEEIQAMLSAV